MKPAIYEFKEIRVAIVSLFSISEYACIGYSPRPRFNLNNYMYICNRTEEKNQSIIIFFFLPLLLSLFLILLLLILSFQFLFLFVLSLFFLVLFPLLFFPFSCFLLTFFFNEPIPFLSSFETKVKYKHGWNKSLTSRVHFSVMRQCGWTAFSKIIWKRFRKKVSLRKI